MWTRPARVGIGVTNPLYKLEVRNASGATQNTFLSNNDWSIGVAGSALGIGSGAASGNTYFWLQGYTGGGVSTNGDIALAPGGGSVGIGTISPNAPLSIAGTAGTSSTSFASFGGTKWRFQQTAGDESNAGVIDYRNFDANALSILGAGTSAGDRRIRLYNYVGVNTPPVNGIALALYGDASASSTSYSAWGSDVLRFMQVSGDESNAGAIGYKNFDSNALAILGGGTSNSNRLVHIYDRLGVNAVASTNQTLLVDGTGATYAAIFQNGYVGVGTSAPGYALDVNPPSDAAFIQAKGTYAGLRLNHTTTNNSSWVGFLENDVAKFYVGMGVYSADSTNLDIGTASSSLVRIQSTGNVGIGTGTTLTAGYRLQIVGGALCVDDATSNCPASPTSGAIYVENSVGSGNVSAFDVAEFYPASEPVEKGELVVADPENPGQVKRSSASYQPTLLGIVSSNPAGCNGGKQHYLWEKPRGEL